MKVEIIPAIAMNGFIIPPMVSPICLVSVKSQLEKELVKSIGDKKLNNMRIIAIENSIQDILLFSLYCEVYDN